MTEPSDLPGDLKDSFNGALGLITALPHAAELGLEVLEAGTDHALMRAPYDPRLVGDPETGVIHGGLITTLLDTCCGLAAMLSHTRPASAATLDLRFDYMRPATPGREVIARARCHRATRSVAFVQATAYHPEAEDKPIATATAAFILEGAPS